MTQVCTYNDREQCSLRCPGEWTVLDRSRRDSGSQYLHTKQTILRILGVRKPSLVILPGKSGFVNECDAFYLSQIVGTLWTSQD